MGFDFQHPAVPHVDGALCTACALCATDFRGQRREGGCGCRCGVGVVRLGRHPLPRGESRSERTFFGREPPRSHRSEVLGPPHGAAGVLGGPGLFTTIRFRRARGRRPALEPGPRAMKAAPFRRVCVRHGSLPLRERRHAHRLDAVLHRGASRFARPRLRAPAPLRGRRPRTRRRLSARHRPYRCRPSAAPPAAAARSGAPAVTRSTAGGPTRRSSPRRPSTRQ